MPHIIDGRTLAEENERVMMEGLNQIPDAVRNAVMVLGRTGSGKSALINMLADRSLIAQRDEVTLRFFVTSQDMLPGITIGNHLLSETSVPHAWIYNDTAFWDCPGFDDNRGIEYEISHAFMFKKLFDTYQSCKILIVISDDDLNDRRAENILPAIKALDAFFQSDVERIRPGLMLVISGAHPDKTIENIHGTFQRIINTPAFNLTDDQKDILRLFITNPIIIFNTPIAEGSFDTAACAQECLNTIEQLRVINGLRVNPTVSPTSQVVLLEMYANLLRSTNLEIDNLMSNLSLQLQGSITRAQDSQNYQELTVAIEAFQEISDRFNNEVALSNSQLLLEIIPACMQANINQHIDLPILSLRNMLYKTEIFDFLEQFVERHARTTLGIEAAITGYLSNCMRDAKATIQAIELQQTGERITTLQFNAQRETAARIAAEARIIEMTQSLQKIAKELEEAKQKEAMSGKTKYVCLIM